ncbi:MAG: Succinate-semialdehyde dehydrogenase [NAD]; Succinate-semialdehyde dehydrogenase [NADP+], partial [uncultured Blastococcus sp.]
GHRHHQPGDRRDAQDLRAAVGRGARAQDRARRRRLADLPADLSRAARGLAAGGRRRPGRRHRRSCRADDHRDGQDLRRGEGGGRQVRHGPALVRRARPGDAAAGAEGRRRGEGEPGLRRAPADRRRPGDHAVELPAVAGHAVRRSGADGRQRRPAQAREQRAADRAVPRGARPQGGLPRRRLPDPADRVLGRRTGPARRPGGGGDPHGQRPGRAVRRLHRGRRAQEDGAGAGWQRPVHRHAVGGSGEGGRGGGHRPQPEQRAELHRGETLLRPPGRRRGVHPAVRREDRCPDRRRPDGRGHPDRAPGHRVRARGRGEVRRRRRREGGGGPRRRQAGRPARLVLRAHPAQRDHAADGPVRRGGLRPGGRAVHRRLAGGGDRDRQQPPLRPRREPVERGRGRARGVHRRRRRRDGVRQRDGHQPSRAAFRRCEAERLRPGADRGRHARVHERQDRLDRPAEQRAGGRRHRRRRLGM